MDTVAHHVNKELPRKWSAWASGTVSLSSGFDLLNGGWIKFGRATAGTNAERPWKEKHTYVNPCLTRCKHLLCSVIVIYTWE